MIMGESEAIPQQPVQPVEIIRNMNTGEPIIDQFTGQPMRKFRPASEITEEMRDPDYALKQLAKMNNGRYLITCSKCHHCR